MHTVTDCCRAIDEAFNDDTAAKNTCATADEKRCIKSFLKADFAAFQQKHLVAFLGGDKKKRRHLWMAELQTPLGQEALQGLALIPRLMLQRPLLSEQSQCSSKR